MQPVYCLSAWTCVCNFMFLFLPYHDSANACISVEVELTVSAIYHAPLCTLCTCFEYQASTGGQCYMWMRMLMICCLARMMSQLDECACSQADATIRTLSWKESPDTGRDIKYAIKYIAGSISKHQSYQNLLKGMFQSIKVFIMEVAVTQK